MIPSSLALGGAALLVGAVTALYLLKVRRRRVALAGASLWQQAQRQVPPRLLGGRWRRPLAWLLSLLIVLLLWLVVVGLHWTAREDGQTHVFYLDGSAWLLGADRFDAAAAALQRDVAALPGTRSRVVLGGQSEALLLAPGENPALLAARLHDAHAQALPSSFSTWFARTIASAPRTVVHYYGAQPVLDAALAGAADGAHLQAGYLAPAIVGNRGIVSLGSAPAASGRWDRVDVLIGTEGAAGQQGGGDALTVTLDGRSVAAVAGAEPGVHWLRDLPATGAVLKVAFAGGDDFPADDSAALRLPLRQPLRLSVSAAAPALLRSVIAVDPSLQVVDAGKAQVQVQVLMPDDTALPGIPAMRLTKADASAAFQFQVGSDAQAESIAGRLAALGIDQAGNTALAQELQRPVAVDVRVIPDQPREVAVWADAISVAHGFTGSTAWPLFVNRSLHWLADAPASTPSAAAGEVLQQDLLLEGLGQSPRLLDAALGDRVRLPAAGEVTVAGAPLQVSLLDRSLAAGVAAPVTATLQPVAAGVAGGGAVLPSALLLLALLLLALEWQLHVRGRMP